MDIFEDRESKKNEGIKYSLLKQNRDGIARWVSALDGNNGDNLRLLSSLCLCLLALPVLLPATFVL